MSVKYVGNLIFCGIRFFHGNRIVRGNLTFIIGTILLGENKSYGLDYGSMNLGYVCPSW